MITPPSETLNPNPNETWTLVTRRRRAKPVHNPTPRSKTLTLTLTLTPRPNSPSPWTPANSSSDPESESKLLRRIQSSIRLLEHSRFFRRFLSRFRNPNIQTRFNSLLSSGPQIQIVSYGIGSIESHKVPRLQLALILLVKQELGARSAGLIEVFDPVFSAVDCAVLAALGCKVIDVDEFGGRAAVAPTMFYMPHCEAVLYDNLLSANWGPVMLRRMVVLGNSFGVYEKNAREMRGVGRLDLEVDGRHLLGIMRYVREVEMEEREKDGFFKDDGDDEVDFFKAFQHMSWHFFELDDDADLGLRE